MSSRATWLKHTREYKKQNVYGRKYFKIHKNQHDIEVVGSKASVSPLPNRNDPIVNHSTPTPNMPHSYSEYPTLKKLGEREYVEQLKQKDSELRLLRKLYNETSQKLKNVEQFRYIEENLKGLNSSQTNVRVKKENIMENQSVERINFRGTELPELKNFRNKSSSNYRPMDISAESPINRMFRQPSYTKNRPKIMFVNPITGIPPQIVGKYVNF